MDLDKPPQTRANRRPPEPYEGGEGCLTVAVRIPVRIVVLVLVVPVRMIWDLLAAGTRLLGRTLGTLGHVLIEVPLVWLYEKLLTPLGRGLLWLVVALWRYALVPVVYYGLVVPVVWICREVLAPAGRGIGGALGWLYETLLTPLGHGMGWLGTALLVWPWVTLWRYVLVPLVYYGLVVPVAWTYRDVLTPVGHGIAWALAGIGRGLVFLARAGWAAVVWLVLVLLVAPLGWLYRRILAPVGREIGAALAFGWRAAGYVSHAVGRALAWLAWHVVGRPARWTYRYVCTPVGHWTRGSVLAPAKAASLAAGRAARETFRSARQSVRQARKDAWRVLAGPPGKPGPREPNEDRTRTLGSTTTVPGAVPAPEVSLSDQG